MPVMDLWILKTGGSYLFQHIGYVDTAPGSYEWNIPPNIPTSTYWLIALIPGTYSGRAWFPKVSGKSAGSVGFTITKIVCKQHSDCPITGQYCDTTGACTNCQDCLLYRDGIDGTCPSSSACGNQGTPFTVGEARPIGTEASASIAIQAPLSLTCAGAALVTNNNTKISFAADSLTGFPRRMTSGLMGKLSNLADAIVPAFGQNYALRVNAAFLLAPTPIDPTNASLHYEGRAASLSLSHPTATITQSQLATLALMATQNGFSYVSFPDPNFVRVSTTPGSCKVALDLVILLDASGSIDDPTYGGVANTFSGKILPFIKQLVSSFVIGPNDTRIAVVTFSSEVVINFYLNTFNNVKDMTASIDSIYYLSGGTQTSKGVDAVANYVFTEAKGMRPLSSGVSRVMMVITDGQANDGYQPKAAATALRNNLNVNVFSIGVGAGINVPELVDMASSPSATHVYTLKSFAIINQLIGQMSTVTCGEPAILTPGDTSTVSISGCEIKYFKPQCGVFTSSLVIEVTDVQGSTNVYLSSSAKNPSPFANDQWLAANVSRKVFAITRTSTNIVPVYIAVQGVGSVNSFTLNVWSG
jgi:uncharacterized protein YegL